MPWALISLMMSKIFSTSMGARPMDGSSSIISLGPAIRARPMASICCSPPDSVPPGWDSRSLSTGKRSKTRSKSALRSWPVREKAPISRFSLTVMRGKIRRPSGAWESPSVTTS